MSEKNIIVLLTVLLGAIAVYAFVKGELWGAPEEGSMRLEVGYIPIADCAQLYVGIDQGYFSAEGLEIELVKMAGGAKILEALAGGSIHVGFSNVISLILASSKGLDFLAISGGSMEDSLHRFSGILVPVESKINGIADLKGKVIAVNTKKNIVEMFLSEVLKENKIESGEFRLQEIPFPNMEKVMITAEVDAIAAVEPYLTFALKNGSARKISDLFTYSESEVEVACYNASGRWVNNNKEVVEKFNAALEMATDFIRKNEDETRSVIAKFTGLSEEQVEEIVLPSFVTGLSVNKLQGLCEKAYERGWTDSEIDAKKLIWNW